MNWLMGVLQTVPVEILFVSSETLADLRVYCHSYLSLESCTSLYSFSFLKKANL